MSFDKCIKNALGDVILIRAFFHLTSSTYAFTAEERGYVPTPNQVIFCLLPL
jgi:hypothetical protein